MRKYLTPAMIAAALFGSEAASAAPVLQPNDFIIAIDSGPPISFSDSPDGEGSLNAIDGNVGTKYLNFGEIQTGLMVTPALPHSPVQSMRFTTANDFSARDPLNWELYGTNDAIDHGSANHGTSIIPGVNWTLISNGDANLPGTLPGGGQFLPSPPNPPNTPDPANDGRNMQGPLYSFANTTGYSSYRLLFPTTKDPNGLGADSMQIAEIEMFPSLDGPASSANILSILDSASAFQLPQAQSRTPGAEGVANAIDGNRFDLPAQSSYPATEGPGNVVDGTPAKYLNGGGSHSGFIVSPVGGASTVRSFQITTANDAEIRDPTRYELYGTNDAITSADNSHGIAENWMLISSGPLTLPTTRDTLGPIVPVSNEASYTSYKMVFPRTVGSVNFQIAEASFFSTSDGMGPDILNAGDPVRATGYVGYNETKYLNFGEENSGLIVTADAVPKVITGMQITTANDAEGRDPASYEIYGTNDPITSAPNSQGTAENWTLISSGPLSLPAARREDGSVVTFANSTAYTSYKILFPTLKDAANNDSMQIAGIQLFDNSVAADPDFDGDGDVDGRDFLTWQRNLGATGQTDNDNGDADGNGTVDAQDLALWKAGFSTAAVVAGAIPEPTTASIAVLGMAAAAVAGRARKRC